MDDTNIDNELKTKLLEWLEGTEAFVVEQAPEVAQQMLAWGSVNSTLQIIMGVLLLALTAICIFVFIKCVKKIEADELWIAPCVMSVIICVVSLIFSFSAVGSGITTKLKISVAPKVYLIDQLTK